MLLIFDYSWLAFCRTIWRMNGAIELVEWKATGSPIKLSIIWRNLDYVVAFVFLSNDWFPDVKRVTKISYWKFGERQIRTKFILFEVRRWAFLCEEEKIAPRRFSSSIVTHFYFSLSRTFSPPVWFFILSPSWSGKILVAIKSWT